MSSSPTFLQVAAAAPLSLARISVAVPTRAAAQLLNAPPRLAPSDEAAKKIESLLAGDGVAVPVGHNTLHVFCHKTRTAAAYKLLASRGAANLGLEVGAVRDAVSLSLPAAGEGAALAAAAAASLAAAGWHRLAPGVYMREDWGALPAGVPASVTIARACSAAALEAAGWAGGSAPEEPAALARALLGCVAVSLPSLTEVTIIDVIARYPTDGPLVAAWEELAGRQLPPFSFWLRVVPGDDDEGAACGSPTAGWLAPPPALLLPPPLPSLPGRAASSVAALRSLADALAGPWMAGFWGGAAVLVVGVAEPDAAAPAPAFGWALAGGAPAAPARDGGGGWTVRPLPPVAAPRGRTAMGIELLAALSGVRESRSRTAAAAQAGLAPAATQRAAATGSAPVLGKRKIITMVGVRVAKPKPAPGFPAAGKGAKKAAPPKAAGAAAKPAPKAPADPAVLAAKVAAVEAAFSGGAQTTLGVDDLRAFLKSRAAKVGGKKADLLARAAGLLGVAATVET